MHIYDLPKVDHTKAVMRKLLTVSVVCFILMCAEITGGYLASSLAIMTDAAHLFSDLSGFFISVFSLFLSRKAASNHLSFGYHRLFIYHSLLEIKNLYFIIKSGSYWRLSQCYFNLGSNNLVML